MFKGIVIRVTGPICHCEERNLAWTTMDSPTGPSMKFWCQECGVTVVIPNKEFKASFALDQPYPGKKPVSVVPQRKGDVVDFTEYLRRRNSGDLPS